MGISTSFQQVAVGRYIGKASGLGQKASPQALTNTLTIPANTVTNGVLICCAGTLYCNPAQTSTVEVRCDSSSPPTTGQYSISHTSNNTKYSIQAFVTGLTWSQVNYINVYATATAPSAECFEVIAFAF